MGDAPAPLPADAGFLERISAPYLPLNHAIWVSTARYGSNAQDAALARDAWHSPGLGFFRWFALYPVVYRIERGAPSTCVWFQDLRFFTPGRNVWPFRFGACRDGSHTWQPYRLEAEGARTPVN
jgi:inner membrane protein